MLRGNPPDRQRLKSDQRGLLLPRQNSKLDRHYRRSRHVSRVGPFAEQSPDQVCRVRPRAHDERRPPLDQAHAEERKDGTLSEAPTWWIKYCVNGKLIREKRRTEKESTARKISEAQQTCDGQRNGQSEGAGRKTRPLTP